MILCDFSRVNSRWDVSGAKGCARVRFFCIKEVSRVKLFEGSNVIARFLSKFVRVKELEMSRNQYCIKSLAETREGLTESFSGAKQNIQ